MLTIQKNLTRSFYILLSLPATAMGFALAVQISALSWILTTKYGLDIHDVGLVWAAGPIAGILGQVQNYAQTSGGNGVDWAAVLAAVKERRGYPVRVSR